MWLHCASSLLPRVLEFLIPNLWAVVNNKMQKLPGTMRGGLHGNSRPPLGWGGGVFDSARHKRVCLCSPSLSCISSFSPRKAFECWQFGNTLCESQILLVALDELHNLKVTT